MNIDQVTLHSYDSMLYDSDRNISPALSLDFLSEPARVSIVRTLRNGTMGFYTIYKSLPHSYEVALSVHALSSVLSEPWMTAVCNDWAKRINYYAGKDVKDVI